MANNVDPNAFSYYIVTLKIISSVKVCVLLSYIAIVYNMGIFFNRLVMCFIECHSHQ